MRHPSSLAVTYQTTVAQLSPAAAEFFRVIAWFAPDPIPFSALEGRHAPPAARALLAELENLSLARRDAAGTSFTLHRLVQEITRQQQSAPPPPPTLLVALKWLHGLFSYQADDIRTWPVAEPLAPHTHAAALHAAAHNIPEPTAGLLNRVALLYKAKARHDAAEPLMRQALAIDEATFGKDDPAVATDLNNLALLLKDTNRLAEAESLLRRALSIDEAAPAKDHPNISRDLINLAQVLYITNRLDEAEALVRRALAIDEATYGKNHPTFATSLNSLATLLMSTGRLDEAEAHYRDVLAIDEAVLGKDHPKVAIVLNNLTLLLCESKRFTEAEPLTRRALAIDEAHFGMVHPQVAIHLRTLASVLQKTNRHADAEPLMRLALEIYVEFTRTTGHEHSHLTEACENYSLLLEAMGDTPAQIEEKLARLLAHLRPAGP
ncbi:MAG: tetratricopeptide repeat protein [Verrucomicrobia bacterium]|nr:tetratricopeptide repeat protein [Verrucomicrobiota bacterium]